MYNTIEKRGSELSLKDFFKTPIDYYDKFRPRTGIRYKLSQTEANYKGDITKFRLTTTQIEFEPGQDLSEPVESDGEIQYLPSRCRGPVWVFQEEKDAIKASKERRRNIVLCQDMLTQLKTSDEVRRRRKHREIIQMVGPKWFQELSNEQLKVADNLKYALIKDYNLKEIINTQEALTNLGIVLRPNHSKVEYALNKCYNCPIEFLLTLFKIIKPNRKTYSLNDKILLSAVVHLTIRDTLKELHLRIPSPTRPKKKVFKKKVKKMKRYPELSPYIQPVHFLKRATENYIYKNRHKEYATSRYFDYVNEMYEEIEDPKAKEEIPQSESKGPIIISKYAKPPKIPVRLITRIAPKPVMIKRLIKPSAYVSNCKKIALAEMAGKDSEEDQGNRVTEETIKLNTEINLNQLCQCTTNAHNKDFTLNIKISSGSERILLKQDFNPYKETTGPLIVQKFEKIVPIDKNKKLSVVADLVEKCTCNHDDMAIPAKICKCATKKLVFCNECTSKPLTETETEQNPETDDWKSTGTTTFHTEQEDNTICGCPPGGDDISCSSHRSEECSCPTESKESSCLCEGVMNEGTEEGCQCPPKNKPPEIDCPCGGLLNKNDKGKKKVEDKTPCTCLTTGKETCKCGETCRCLEIMNLKKICKCTNPKKTIIQKNPICTCDPENIDLSRICSCSKQHVIGELRCTCPSDTSPRYTCSPPSSKFPQTCICDLDGPDAQGGIPCSCTCPSAKRPEENKFVEKVEALLDRPFAPKTCTCDWDPNDPSTHIPKTCTCDIQQRITVPQFVCKENEKCEGDFNSSKDVDSSPRHGGAFPPTCTCGGASPPTCTCGGAPKENLDTCVCSGNPKNTNKCKCTKVYRKFDPCECKCTCGKEKSERPKVINEAISKRYEDGRKIRMEDLHRKHLTDEFLQEMYAQEAEELAMVQRGPSEVTKSIFKRSGPINIEGMRSTLQINSTVDNLNRNKTRTKLQFLSDNKFISDQGIMPVSSKEQAVRIKDFEELEEIEIFKDESPTCKCEKIYNEFMLEHDECVNLYDDYEYYMLQELDQYLQDLKPNTCGCTDVDKYAPSTPNDVCDLALEKSGRCQPQKYCIEASCEVHDFAVQTVKDEVEEEKVVCDCMEMLEDDDGCICLKTGSDEPEWQYNPCNCPPPYICKCKKDGKTKTNKKREDEGEDVEVDADDPRIFKITKFPQTTTGQMNLLKKALDTLAKDNYPLAQLPECWKLPHFKLWLNFRSKKYISMQERHKYTLRSKSLWTHIRLCIRRVDKPYLGIDRDQLKKMTWKSYKKYHRIIADKKTDYYRRLRRAYIDEAREFFPSTFHHHLPTHSFRDCFFAYLPQDENHMHPIHPWFPHEIKNMKTRKPCV